MIKRLYLIVALTCFAGACAKAPSAQGPFSGLIGADQSLVSQHIGQGWVIDTRIVIPDINDLSAAEPHVQKIGHMLSDAMKSIRVQSVYDLSASPPDGNMPDNLSVKVLVFENEDAAVAFARSKYENANSGFEKAAPNGSQFTYRGTRYGKIVKIDGRHHVSVFRLHDASQNAALAYAVLQAVKDAQRT